MNDIEERIRSALTPYRFEDDLVVSKYSVSRPSRQRPGRSRAALIAAVAAAVVLLLVASVTLPRWIPGSPNPAAAGLLHRFARISLQAQSEPAPQPGQYVYRETMAQESYVYVSGDGQYRFVYSIPVRHQQWLGLDGSGLQVNVAGDHPSFPTASDRSTYQAFVASGNDDAADLQSDFGATTHDRYGPGELSWRDTSTLPTDPAELGRLIEKRDIVSGPDGDWESFVLATDLIRDTYARPELRAAIYEYMAGLTGIEVVGTTADTDGRPGVALASTHDGIRHEVVFDRSNGKILEERDVVLDPDEKVFNNPGPGEYAYAYAGQPVYVATYLSFGEVVDAANEMPR